MFSILSNHSLKDLNTFGFDVTAEYYIEVKSVEEVKGALQWINAQELKYIVLGGGSNLLFTGNFIGVVLKPNIMGIEHVDEDDEHVTLRVGAGVDWDELVAYTVEKGLGGLENLSIIPGNVGASPIQNIGAYGVEAKDTIELVEGVNSQTLEPFTLTKAQCNFGYRDSVFKNELKGKVVITHVTFRLNKNLDFQLHYGNLTEELKRYGDVSLENIRKAVISIRNAKLPDPKEIGNAGSFFKNPVVNTQLVDELKVQYDRVPAHSVTESLTKVPAGWLIEQCGWKGKRVGNVGVHANQALVLVNYGNGTGQEVFSLAQNIRQSVKDKFNIMLEMEVNVI